MMIYTFSLYTYVDKENKTQIINKPLFKGRNHPPVHTKLENGLDILISIQSM